MFRYVLAVWFVFTWVLVALGGPGEPAAGTTAGLIIVGSVIGLARRADRRAKQ